MNNKKQLKFMVSFLLIAVILATMIIPASASSGTKISPAFDILQKDLSLIKTGMVSGTLSFAPEDFEESLSVKKISSVTILSLPLITSGKLMLGSLEVMKNQTISRTNLDKLTFVPNGSEVCDASFLFRGNIDEERSYDVTCSLYMIDSENSAPTSASVGDIYKNVSTLKNIMVYGTLRAVDPENDALKYEIVAYPKKGMVRLTDTAYGNYTYTPASGYVGKDSFIYRSCDKYGNHSEDVKVNIKVELPSTDIIYTDLKGHWAQNAAVSVTAKGIMSGKSIGDETVFNPDGVVSRCEFLVMTMKATGFRGNNGDIHAIDTGFADDADIPEQYKDYVAAAASLGYISGFANESGTTFCPNNQITRAEAAVMLCNMLDAKEPVIRPVFADITGVPAWADDALCAMSEMGILRGTGEGYISPYTVINRAQAAQILSSIINL